MDRTRQTVLAFALGRGAFGAGLTAAPAKVASGWLEQDAGRPRAQVAIRGLGARDIALAGGTAAAAAGGAPVRPWLLATLGCDLADIGATLASAGALGSRAKTGTVLLAGATALAGALLAAWVDE